MTKQQAKCVKPGDIIIHDGLEFEVLRVNVGWKGFLTSSQLEKVRNTPDYYYFTVRETPFLQFDHKAVQLKGEQR